MALADGKSDREVIAGSLRAASYSRIDFSSTRSGSRCRTRVLGHSGNLNDAGANIGDVHHRVGGRIDQHRDTDPQLMQADLSMQSQDGSRFAAPLHAIRSSRAPSGSRRARPAAIGFAPLRFAAGFCRCP